MRGFDIIRRSRALEPAVRSSMTKKLVIGWLGTGLVLQTLRLGTDVISFGGLAGALLGPIQLLFILSTLLKWAALAGLGTLALWYFGIIGNRKGGR